MVSGQQGGVLQWDSFSLLLANSFQIHCLFECAHFLVSSGEIDKSLLLFSAPDPQNQGV